MSKHENKFICFLLVLIIILAFCLIYKIKSEPEYDEKLYNEIYSEYIQISTNESEQIENGEQNKSKIFYKRNLNGQKYRVIGSIRIPKIGIEYPIIYETSEEYLKIAPTKLFGPEVNQVGNLCIVGHNYRNEKFFSRLYQLEIGDKVYLENNSTKCMTYLVYDKYEIDENDMNCTNQNTKGNIELTLITCTTKKKNRLVIKCKALS